MIRAGWLGRAAASGALGLLVAGGLAPVAHAEPVFAITGGTAPLGMATDHERDRYWVLTNSTGRLTIEAYGADGTRQGRMRSRDTVTNVQALAFTGGEVFVGDVGGSRKSVVVWQAVEPWPGTEINQAVKHTFVYPDGQHQAAAILVDSQKRIRIVTDGQSPGIYEAPADPVPDVDNALTRVANAPAGVTDATVMADGRFALLTKSSIVTLDPASYRVLAQGAIPAGQGGSALTQAVDQRLMLTAGSGGQVTSVSVPGVLPVTTTPRTNRPEVIDAQAPDRQDTRTFAQTGTTVALWIAVGGAVLAAAIALFKR